MSGPVCVCLTTRLPVRACTHIDAAAAAVGAEAALKSLFAHIKNYATHHIYADSIGGRIRTTIVRDGVYYTVIVVQRRQRKLQSEVYAGTALCHVDVHAVVSLGPVSAPFSCVRIRVATGDCSC